MSTSKQTPENDEAIEAVAAAWLVQQEEGFTAEQAAEFERWQQANRKHAAAVAMLAETCGILEKIPALREDPATSRELDTWKQAQPAGNAPVKIVRFPAVLKIAAALAACVVVALAIWGLRPAGDTFTHSYATAAGECLRVVLPDQSILELNAASEARVQFSDASRRVTLAQGEAHFTVVKDARRPFVVGAGKVAVRAVGTAFNVRMDESAVEVLVTEGRVRVSREALATAIAATAERSTPEAPVLTAGQRVVIPGHASAAGALPVLATHAAAIRNALAWQSPRLVFVETRLSDVVSQFNQHNRVQLSIADDDLAARPVDGTFRADHVETFVSLLQTSGDIAVERPEANRIVLRKVAR